MSEPSLPATAVHEPNLDTVELLCERLGELGLPIGPDTARGILRAVLAAEAPRMEAHVREALEVSIETIRVAAQAALGTLTSTTPVRTRPVPASPPKPVLDPAPRRVTPGQPRPTPAGQPRPTPTRRPIAKRITEEDPGEDAGGEKRPVFRRPRGR
ncbi:MAG TPA: hypothetical protein VMY76_13055 [Gemmatimonadales bacterium]|nr:hypothetical protein [Gemmatimonadales bacterium]